MEAYQNFFHIGQYTDSEAMTGCTVILCEDGVTGGVSVRGGSPNTRDTDAKRVKQHLTISHFKREIMVLEQAAVSERSMVQKTL